MAPTAPVSQPLLGVPKKRKATNACESCRAVKVKCTGQQPCTRCVENNIECVLDLDRDKRQKRLLKRRVSSLEDDQKLFIRLLRTLRHRNHHVDGLLDYIRDERPSLDQIKEYMDHHLPQRELEKSPQLLELYEGLATRPADRALSIARLCDIPPFTGHAKPWTTVTDDDQFVSHLISLYFTWCCLAFNFIDRDLFLRDFNSGGINSLYCSPFLVNAMLADACYYSDYPESCAVPGDTATNGEHFWREAKRLLDIEGDKLNLTTVQGLAVMYSCSSVMGKDRLGMTYFARASKAIQHLRSSYEKSSNDASIEKVRSEVLDHLEIGLFGIGSLSYLSLQKVPAMDRINCAQLPVHQRDQDQWFPYPLQVDPSPAAHTNCVLNQKATLAHITWDLSHALFEDNSRPPRADVEDAVNKSYTRLLRWAEDLPECLHYNDKSLREVLSLQLVGNPLLRINILKFSQANRDSMYYHLIIMTGFAFLKIPVPQADSATLESLASTQEKCISSAQAVSTLVTISTSQWGAGRQSMVDLQFICVALYVLMEDLSDATNHDVFLNLTKASMSMAELGLLPKGMFRLVQVVTLQLNDPETLSPAISKVFKRFEKRLWRREDHQRFSSAYPNFAAALRQQDGTVPEDLELDDFLEIWNDFTISGQTDSEASERER